MYIRCDNVVWCGQNIDKKNKRFVITLINFTLGL